MLCWCAPFVFSFICFHRADDFQSSKLGQFELKIAAYQHNPHKQSYQLNPAIRPTRLQGPAWCLNPTLKGGQFRIFLTFKPSFFYARYINLISIQVKTRVLTCLFKGKKKRKIIQTKCSKFSAPPTPVVG